MEPFTLSELGLFVGTIGGVITGLIFALQKSRCETINCCGIKCKRKIKEEDDDDKDIVPTQP
tara:strand:+ start:331 stop:516 length:186 start_codon:yes stop_codon:yes gene_type:complete